jgi:hypothetical protein
MSYATADVVRSLREVWDRVDKLRLSDDDTFRAVTREMARRFPDLPIDQWLTALRVWNAN